jgi:hypothetical protein
MGHFNIFSKECQILDLGLWNGKLRLTNKNALIDNSTTEAKCNKGFCRYFSRTNQDWDLGFVTDVIMLVWNKS